MLRVRGIPTETFNYFRDGGADANGQAPIVMKAEGGANPCRHCLGLIADGETKLVLSYRPFHEAQPYAETGPIFLHQSACARYEGDSLPAWFAFLDPAAIRVPTLIIRPEKDFLSTEAETLEFFQKLGTNNKSYAFLPDGGHAILLEKNYRKFQNAVLAFLDQP